MTPIHTDEQIDDMYMRIYQSMYAASHVDPEESVPYTPEELALEGV